MGCGASSEALGPTDLPIGLALTRREQEQQKLSPGHHAQQNQAQKALFDTVTQQSVKAYKLPAINGANANPHGSPPRRRPSSASLSRQMSESKRGGPLLSAAYSTELDPAGNSHAWNSEYNISSVDGSIASVEFPKTKSLTLPRINNNATKEQPQQQQPPPTFVRAAQQTTSQTEQQNSSMPKKPVAVKASSSVKLPTVVSDASSKKVSPPSNNLRSIIDVPTDDASTLVMIKNSSSPHGKNFETKPRNPNNQPIPLQSQVEKVQQELIKLERQQKEQEELEALKQEQEKLAAEKQQQTQSQSQPHSSVSRPGSATGKSAFVEPKKLTPRDKESTPPVSQDQQQQQQIKPPSTVQQPARPATVVVHDPIPIQDAETYAKLYYMYSDQVPEYRQYKTEWESEQLKYRAEREAPGSRLKSRSIYSPEPSASAVNSRMCSASVSSTPSGMSSPYQMINGVLTPVPFDHIQNHALSGGSAAGGGGVQMVNGVLTPVPFVEIQPTGVISPIPGGQLVADGTALCLLIENSRPGSVCVSPLPGYKIAYDPSPVSPSFYALGGDKSVITPLVLPSSPNPLSPALSQRGGDWGTSPYGAAYDPTDPFGRQSSDPFGRQTSDPFGRQTSDPHLRQSSPTPNWPTFAAGQGARGSGGASSGIGGGDPNAPPSNGHNRGQSRTQTTSQELLTQHRLAAAQAHAMALQQQQHRQTSLGTVGSAIPAGQVNDSQSIAQQQSQSHTAAQAQAQAAAVAQSHRRVASQPLLTTSQQQQAQQQVGFQPQQFQQSQPQQPLMLSQAQQVGNNPLQPVFGLRQPVAQGPSHAVDWMRVESKLHRLAEENDADLRNTPRSDVPIMLPAASATSQQHHQQPHLVSSPNFGENYPSATPIPVRRMDSSLAGSEPPLSSPHSTTSSTASTSTTPSAVRQLVVSNASSQPRAMLGHHQGSNRPVAALHGLSNSANGTIGNAVVASTATGVSPPSKSTPSRSPPIVIRSKVPSPRA